MRYIRIHLCLLKRYIGIHEGSSQRYIGIHKGSSQEVHRDTGGGLLKHEESPKEVYIRGLLKRYIGVHNRSFSKFTMLQNYEHIGCVVGVE